MIHVRDGSFIRDLVLEHGKLYQVRYWTRNRGVDPIYERVPDLWDFLQEPGRDVYMGKPSDSDPQWHIMKLSTFFKRSIFYMPHQRDVVACKLIFSELVDNIKYTTDTEAEYVVRMEWKLA